LKTKSGKNDLFCGECVCRMPVFQEKRQDKEEKGL